MLQSYGLYMKPAAEGIGIPYETQSTKSRGQSTSHQPSSFKPSPTLLMKIHHLENNRQIEVLIQQELFLRA